MASKSKSNKKKQILYLITKVKLEIVSYHYTAVKTKKLIQENRKLKLRKFNPIKQKHEMFVEANLSNTKNNGEIQNKVQSLK